MARASQNYYPDWEYLNKKNRVFSLNQEMLDKINNIPDVIDNLTSTSSTDALSANMWRELSKQIQSLESWARWLSTWDSRFWIPNTFPGTLPYQYKAWDNYLVSQVSDTANYRPDWSQFIWDRSFVVETSEVHPWDSYIYDWTNWILQVNSPIEVNEYTAWDGIKIDENNEISVKSSAIAWTWLTTDSNNNLIVDSSLIAWKTEIPTNISQLINDRWYITEDDINTKTFYISSSSDLTNAQAALDWYKDGKNPIVSYNDEMYYFKEYQNDYYKKLWFYKNNLTVLEVWNRTMIYRSMLWFDLDSEGTTVTWIRDYNFDTIAEVLDTSTEYSSPFIPQYDWSPTSKKYVDDNDVQKWSTAPWNPTQGMLWYDTTNNVLKSYDGNNWNEVGSDAADINTKTFYLANNQDTVTGQAILDWVLSWKNAIVWHMWKQIYFKYISKTSSRVTFHSEWYEKAWSSMPAPGRYLSYYIMYLNYSGSTLSSIEDYYGDNAVGYLSTVAQNYRYTPSNEYDPATKKYVDDKFSAWNYIDIKNGVISAVWLQENLTAWDNITFYEYCHANTQWPCPDGFHIPTNDEATALLNTWITLWAWTGTDGTSLNNFETYLNAPWTWYYASMLRLQRSWCVERWTSSTFRQWNFGYKFSHTSASAGIELQQTACWTIIRPFKNEWVAPDSSWTTVYDWSSVAQWAWIFHNATEWIISISADWTTRITIADKNLWATQVWNYWDTFTADNIGKMYQWWNNYWFEFSATQPKTSADKVDASWYWPNIYLGGNYYYGDTFIQNSDWWDSSANKNLWWWNDLTWVWCDHMISAESTTYTAWTWINIAQNDEISVDTSIVATQTDLASKQDALTAWDNITIGDAYTTESDMKWPAPDWFHVPLITEWEWLKTIMDWLSLTTWTDWRENLRIPSAGIRNRTDAATGGAGGFGSYWSSSPMSSPYNAHYLYISGADVSLIYEGTRTFGYSIRCFKDSYVVPTSSWTVVQWTLWSAGIFRNQTEWLISITSDWTTWYTIADKNLWATTVWNNWDTLSEANCGKYYQRGNNYWFPFTWNVSTSSTQVDTTGYWPWNYYTGADFIVWIPGSTYDWSNPSNDNLRWWVTQWTWQDCIHNVISSTDTTYTAWNWISIDANNEISVDNTIARASDVNTKTFYLANNSDLVTAQAAYDWWAAGKNPIVIRKYAGIESIPFSVYRLMDNTLEFTALYSWVNDVSYNTKRQRRMEFRTLNWTVNDIIFVNLNYINYIDPTATYSVPFIPTQDGQPATKKYVDDSISWIVIPTYAAWTWLTLNWTTFNVDTTTIATKEDIANLRTFIVVNTLPSVDTANEKAIYMLGPIWTWSDKYEEYIVTRWDYNWTSATTMYPFSVTRNTWDWSILHDSQTSPLSDFNWECYVWAKITAISDETKLPVKLSFRDPDSTDSEWVWLNEPAFVYEQYAYPDWNDLDIYIPWTSSSNRVTVSAEWVMSSSPITREQWPKQRTKIWETSIDLSWYATTSALTTWLAAKQDTLTASTWINIDSSNNISNTLPWPTIASTAPTWTEWALWYDTTNDVLMAHDWTAWKEAWTQMKVLSYGHSTWQDFINAYNENAIVYCKASSNSNPWSWNQWRMAFMAYININNSTWLPTEVEFQYYRSRSDHNSAANQLDQVFVYKLTSAWAWTVTERNTWAKAVAWTWINLWRGSGNMTINADTSVLATQTDLSSINWIVSWQIVPPVSSEWEGRIFYCTTDNTFYKCDWTDWTEIWSWWTPTWAITNNTTWTTTSISQIRCGTEAEYQALWTYQEGIAYMTF